MINWFLSVSALSTAPTTIYNNGNQLSKCSWPALGKQNMQTIGVYWEPYENDTATAIGTPQQICFVFVPFAFLRLFVCLFFSEISLSSLHKYDVKWPKVYFIWQQERQGEKKLLSLTDSDAVPSLQLPTDFPSVR